ncbi:ThiF family adenylyltransferase [Alcaligenaceae bacterium CGII-47]|nr:ThiF family adenylyltransferase [Alcaligenaceae bacterium CGII-47]
MIKTLSGALRVHFIVGHPIAQVKSPAGVTQAFMDQGQHAICIPADVEPSNLTAWLAGVSVARNVDGIIVTVPHKFACFELCATTSARSSFLHTVNTMRRNPDGAWHGDMFDGLGFVDAVRAAGYQPRGKRALLVGAGGAGSAIAHALVEAGVAQLAIHDEDVMRRDVLIARLRGLGQATLQAGSADPSGSDIVINATPMGMAPGDPYPVDPAHLSADMFVGCVITAPAVSPFVQAAREKGCMTITGSEMFGCVRDRMLKFLTEV